MSEKENMCVKNTHILVSKQRKERREIDRVIYLEKISKSAMGDTISINREIILVLLLKTWACWGESRGPRDD